MDLKDVKQFVLDGFDEITRNPGIIIECVQDTVEDVEGIIERSKPVIDALAALLEQVSALKEGTANRGIRQESKVDAAARRLILKRLKSVSHAEDSNG